MEQLNGVPIFDEDRRGCGFRKVGGLYLIGGRLLKDCCQLPKRIERCRVCNGGVKPARGWTWIEPHFCLPVDCSNCHEPCLFRAFINRERHLDREIYERGGLLWVGKRFYKDPSAFIKEAQTMGISRRIAQIPRGLEIGETPVFLAHREVTFELEIGKAPDIGPGIFAGFIPTAIQQVISPEQAEDADFVDALRVRGIDPVIVRPRREPEQETLLG